MTASLLILVPALPLALVALLAIGPLRPLGMAILPLAPIAGLLAALAPPLVAELPWLGLGARLETGGMRSGFLLFTALLWSLAAAAALAYLRDDPHRLRFVVLFLLAMAGNLGLIIAADVMTFYALFAMMSLASWGLVLHEPSDFARFAGRTYIVFAIAGELALFAGLALAAGAAGSTLLADLRAAAQPGLATALLMIGFGIKLGAVPLHLWLPLAHAAAPAPASAVLSGAMIKAGLFGMAMLLPFGLVAMPAAGLVLVACGAASILVATLVGVTQTSPKAILAYSSIGQMGLVAIALGVAFAAPDSWPVILPALVLFAAHHAFAKAALFLGVPAFWAARGPAARACVIAALVVPAAALAAAPWTSGAAAKSGLAAAFALGPQAWYAWLYPMLLAGSAGTTMLLVRFLVTLWRQPPKSDLPRAVALPWAAMTMLAAAGLWLLPFGVDARAADPLSDMIPVAAGLALAAAAAAALHTARIGIAEVPPGEVLALFPRGRAVAPLRLPTLDLDRRLGHGLPRLPRRIPEIARFGGLAILVVAALLIAANLRAPATSAASGPAMPPVGGVTSVPDLLRDR